MMNANITQSDVSGMGLPWIAGTWYFVDPTNGSASYEGTTQERAFASITTAYAACTTGAGDGIALISQGTSTNGTTSRILVELDWTKHNITVIGIAAPTRMFQRSRISNATDTTDLAYLIDIQGDNNTFMNVHMFNSGSDAAALGCLKVTGNRNAFVNCHIVGGGHATPAAETGMYSLHASGEENSYFGCTFGTDTIIRGAANGEILFDGSCRRNNFENCKVISYSTTAGHGAINSADATSIDGWTHFVNCTFSNWNTGDISDLTSLFIGTNPNNAGLHMSGCSMVGWAAWDATGGNDRVFIGNSDATASGAGGIATTP